MTKSIPAIATALTLSLGVLSAPHAIAKGGQDNFERQQALQAEFEKARQGKQTDSGSNLFEFLFGADQDDMTTKSKDKANDTKTE